MQRLRWVCGGLGLALAGFSWGQPTPPEAPTLQVNALSPEGRLDYDERTGEVSDPVGVQVKYGDVELTAKRLWLDRQAGSVAAEGNVHLQRATQTWTGEALRYNFTTDTIQAERFRTGTGPFFAEGQGLSAVQTNQTYSATNAFVTTDDVAQPGYRVRARSLTLVPGQYLEARGATLFLGSVPVFYFPTYRRSLTRHPNNFAFTPGYRSAYGPYLLGEYHWVATTNLSGSIHLDYRLQRGLGGGPDVHYDLGRGGRGTLEGYVTRDDDPRTDPLGRPIDDERHRIAFSHSAFVTTNLSVRAAVREQSDAYLIRDFFEGEYRRDIQPRSYLEVNQLGANYSLNVLAQAQVNDFFQTVERLPDVEFSMFRQQLGVSPFYYESDSSLGYFRWRPGDTPALGYAAWRGDTFHQLVLPQTWFGWLNFTPRVGGRLTHYGEVDGRGFAANEQDRAVFNTGAELSFKAARVWPAAQHRLLEVHGLRHIVEPSLNYAFVPEPNRRPPQLPQFDPELRSLRLLPIDYPDYNAIDAIDSQNVLRLGLRNRLQTRRRAGLENLLHWALYTDWRLDPRAGQQTFADVYSDLDLRPRSWLTLNSELRFGLNDGVVREANHTATLLPGETWSWSGGHRYLRDDPQLGPDSGNNLVLSSLYYRLNENWGVRFTHHFEARDGTMEEQYYTVYRDFRSWTTALTLRVREGRGAREDFTLALTLSLKAFPRFALGRDRDEPTYLLGH